MSISVLFDPIHVGHMSLRNRMVMAPMTRSRATQDHIPSELAIEYYKQRCGAGLIITEGTSPAPDGDGYPRTPGIYNDAQMQMWKKITHAVHVQHGKIFLQLMHVGRIAHPFNKAKDARTVAPSNIPATGKMYTDQAGLQDMVLPHALELDEIAQVIAEYKQATINAFECGFDGVELHAASGYLPMQFLSSNTNTRTDLYGGHVDNRIRFVVETLEAMASVKGPERIGIRIWPGSEFNDVHDADPVETYKALLQAIDPMKLAYVHVIRSPNLDIDALQLVRDYYQGISIANGGFDALSADAAIRAGLADLISFGSLYLANPDLTDRFYKNAALNTPDENTFYTPGAKGYIDYPSLTSGT